MYSISLARTEHRRNQDRTHKNSIENRQNNKCQSGRAKNKKKNKKKDAENPLTIHEFTNSQIHSRATITRDLQFLLIPVRNDLRCVRASMFTHRPIVEN